MAITLTGLKTKVLNSINETSGTPHSDAQVYEAINLAQRTVSLWVNTINKSFLSKSAALVRVGSTSAHTLPTDFDMVILLTDSNGHELSEISINDMEWKTGYYFAHDTICIVPTTITAGTLYYTPILADLTIVAPTTELPDQFEYMLTFLAAAELNLRLNDYDAFRGRMEMYEREKALMSSRVRRQTQKGGRVRDTKTLRTLSDG